MKQKNLFYLFTCCALACLTFTACNDDDKVPPTEEVSTLTYTKTDLNLDKIGGTVSWELSTLEGDITGYNIYLGNSATGKDKALGTAPKGATSFDIPAGTDYYPYVLVIAINAYGESNNVASVAIKEADAGVILQHPGMYILNGGNSEANNASLSFYDFTTGAVVSDVYKDANHSGLGDSGEQILIYGSKTYITVTTSNRVVVLDQKHRLVRSIEPKEGETPMNPRRMVAHEGKIYLTYFYGHQVAILDTATLKIEKTVKVGRYPEQLTVANGKLYVANSGGLDFPNYGKTVSVINPSSLQVEKTIDVLLNPVQITSDSQGDVYVISMGDYGDVKNTLQRIDGKTNEVTKIDNASRMTIVNDKLYYIYAQWGDTQANFKVYDALTEKVVNENFITDGTVFPTATDKSGPSLEALSVDPATGKIYITETPFGSTSTLYIFSAAGKQESKFDTKGYYAKSLALLTK